MQAKRPEGVGVNWAGVWRRLDVGLQRFPRWVYFLGLALGLVLAAPAAVQAEDFMFVSESAVFNPSTQEVLFTIEFNEPPDFFTLDEAGRQKHAFQYFIIGDPALPYPENYDAIIRGAEIPITGDRIRIRDAVGYEGDPVSGGWGALRGEVPYRLNGNVLTFSAPLSLISDHSLDGHFTYRLETYQYGSWTWYVENHSIIVSTPMQLDIKPGSADNVINLKSRGVIPVAILTTPGFDASTVLPLSVRLGPGAAPESHGQGHWEDVDRDGDIDLVLHFRTQDIGLSVSDTEACLIGQTTSGSDIEACDGVNIKEQ